MTLADAIPTARDAALTSASRIAALTRRFGVPHFDLVENAMQDAYVRAMKRWPLDGTPDEPERSSS